MPAKNSRAAASALRTLPNRSVREAVARLSREVKGNLAGDIGDDMILSGVKGGKALKVQTKVEGDTIVTGKVTAGPSRSRAQWFWINDGSHPGGGDTKTRAKRTWDRAVDPLLPVLRNDLERDFHAAVQGHG